MNQKETSEFIGKNIIVIGASSGIGLSTAVYFWNEGANVIMFGRDKTTMLDLIKANKFKNVIVIEGDLSKDVSILDLKATAAEIFKEAKIDVIVNCAGVKLNGDLEKSFIQDYYYTNNVNVRSIFLIIKMLKPFINPGASIVNMSCLYGSKPVSGMIAHAMSKAGWESLTRYIAATFARSEGIRVNAVTACPVDTNSLRYSSASETEINYFRNKMKSNIPLGRIAYPDDIIKAIAFWAGDRAKKITGQIIKVDGGRSLTCSGYVHYRGMKNMNARFEPDGVTFTEKMNEVKTKWMGEKVMELPILDVLKWNEFVNNTIKESNFTSNKSDAHISLILPYNEIKLNDDELKKRYIQNN